MMWPRESTVSSAARAGAWMARPSEAAFVPARLEPEGDRGGEDDRPRHGE